MQTIRHGSQTFKLNNNSPTLGLLQKCIDSQKKKTPKPRLKKDKRDYPALYVCKTTADYVRMYYKLNQLRLFGGSWASENEVKTIFPDFFQPMRDAPIPTLQGIDGVEEYELWK